MNDRWRQNAVIYCVEIDVFRDGNGDGIGDFVGLTQGLAYLAGLGVNCLWLLPFLSLAEPGRRLRHHRLPRGGPSVRRPGGFCAVHGRGERPRHSCHHRLVVNHTSDEHPWFRAARREGPGSKYWDDYVWNEHPLTDTHNEVVFPGKQDGVWKRDAMAGTSYFHRFYDFQPDLNMANPAVRAKVKKIMNFW